MPVRPDRLDRITTYDHELDQDKGLRCQRLLWVLVEVAHDVRLPLAAGAGTGPAQGFERNIAFAAIAPPHGQFAADLLDVLRSHVSDSLADAQRPPASPG